MFLKLGKIFFFFKWLFLEWNFTKWNFHISDTILRQNCPEKKQIL